jgi:8-oxo-dGTP pyrophosphatase MutT (NUDIX family)
MIVIEPESVHARRREVEEQTRVPLSAPYPLPDIDPWEQPIIDHMAQFPGKLFKFWEVPSILAADFRTEDRAHLREVRVVIMESLMRLVRERKLVPHKRKWVRIHEAYADNPQNIVPL